MMNAPRFNALLAKMRQNLDPDDEIILIYNGVPAHRKPTIPAANAHSLQPIPEHSGAGNRLTEDSDKKRHIEARNTDSNGRQSKGQTPRDPYRRDENPIAARCSSALHRCYHSC